MNHRIKKIFQCAFYALLVSVLFPVSLISEISDSSNVTLSADTANANEETGIAPTAITPSTSVSVPTDSTNAESSSALVAKASPPIPSVTSSSKDNTSTSEKNTPAPPVSNNRRASKKELLPPILQPLTLTGQKAPSEWPDAEMPLVVDFTLNSTDSKQGTVNTQEKEAEAKGNGQLPAMLVDSLDLTRPQDVGVILRTLARMANQNIVYSEHVTGTVMLSVSKSTPWDEIFRSVLTAKRLNYSWEGTTLRVFSAGDIVEDIALQTALLKNEEGKQQIKDNEPLQVTTLPVRYLDLKMLQAHLMRFITNPQNEKEKPRGYVDIDEENSQIIVKATAEQVAQMLQLVRHLDRSNPQILIEAYIVETSQEVARKLGLDWTGSFATRTREPITKDDVITTAGNAFTGSMTAGMVNGANSLKVNLQALEKENKLKILSSPSILVTNNQQAFIESGEERAYRVTSVTGNDKDVTVEFKTASLKLDVKPHIIDDRKVKLTLTVNKDSFGTAEEENNGQLPVNKKRASTNVILLNGQTTVLGGLTTNEAGNTNTGLPVLRDLPLLGFLFRGEDKSASSSEIMIFITPHILRDSGDYQRIFREPNPEYQPNAQ